MAWVSYHDLLRDKGFIDLGRLGYGCMSYLWIQVEDRDRVAFDDPAKRGVFFEVARPFSTATY